MRSVLSVQAKNTDTAGISFWVLLKCAAELLAMAFSLTIFGAFAWVATEAVVLWRIMQ